MEVEFLFWMVIRGIEKFAETLFNWHFILRVIENPIVGVQMQVDKQRIDCAFETARHIEGCNFIVEASGANL